jgi:phosphosulfolactate phosphohydrolase-like enzyme
VTESVFAQPGAGARFDWGVAGAAELSRACSVLVMVDVLSFSTAVDVAVSRGIRVHPLPWGGQAAEYARRVGAAVPDPPAAVWGCVSGRELAESGYADDVALAVAVDASRTVPLLQAGAFSAAA